MSRTSDGPDGVFLYSGSTQRFLSFSRHSSPFPPMGSRCVDTGSFLKWLRFKVRTVADLARRVLGNDPLISDVFSLGPFPELPTLNFRAGHAPLVHAGRNSLAEVEITSKRSLSMPSGCSVCRVDAPSDNVACSSCISFKRLELVKGVA